MINTSYWRWPDDSTPKALRDKNGCVFVDATGLFCDVKRATPDGWYCMYHQRVMDAVTEYDNERDL